MDCSDIMCNEVRYKMEYFVHTRRASLAAYEASQVANGELKVLPAAIKCQTEHDYFSSLTSSGISQAEKNTKVHHID